MQESLDRLWVFLSQKPKQVDNLTVFSRIYRKQVGHRALKGSSRRLKYLLRVRLVERLYPAKVGMRRNRDARLDLHAVSQLPER